MSTWSLRVLRWLERGLAAAGLVFLVYHAAFDLREVVSNSMAPTLRGERPGAAGNDWVLYETLSTRAGAAPPRSRLVVFRSDEGLPIVKRVAGLPGERLRIVGGRLEVDGVLLPPPAPGVKYTRAGLLRPGPDGPLAHEVPGGAVFLLGDDSKDSWDSRYFGGMPVERLQARAVAVVWPPARWTWLW